MVLGRAPEAAVRAGIWMYVRGSPALAATAFGIGGAFKVYPAFFIVPLVLAEAVQGRPRQAARIGLAGAAPLVLVNLPFVLINFSGWWTTYRFQAERPAEP